MGISVYPSISEVQGNYYGSYTFATKPTASNYPSGSVIRITDVGVSNAGSIWVSTGSAWVPENGQVMLAFDSTGWTAPANDTNENTLTSMTILGGLLGSRGTIEIDALWSFTNSANQKTLRAKLGSTAFLQTNRTTTSEYCIRTQTTITNVGSAASQTAFPIAIANPYASGTTAVVAGTENTATDLTLAFTGQKATGSETLKLEWYRVILFRRQ